MGFEHLIIYPFSGKITKDIAMKKKFETTSMNQIYESVYRFDRVDNFITILLERKIAMKAISNKSGT